MKAEARAGLAFGRNPMPWLAGLALLGLLADTMLAEAAGLPSFCGPLSLAAMAGTAMQIARLWSPGGLLLAWLVMLVAMMPPLLAQPSVHVWHSSPRVRRPRALALFAAGYALVWIAAGGVLIPAAIALRVVAPGELATLAALGLALAWSSAPAAQRARNRCHRVHRIAAFGRAADADCLRHGSWTGAVCAAACWPWMLIPMTVGRFHMVAMIAVTAVLVAERMAPPRSPRWRLPPIFEVLAAFKRSAVYSLAVR